MEKIQKILLNILLIIAIIVIWYWYSHPIFELTFKDDDAHIMRVALSYPWYAFLLEPNAYQELSSAHYTPWVLWSYQLDLFLGNGINPQIFHIHQWLAITLLIFLLSLLAWRITKQVTAAIIVSLLLIINPSIFQLLTENYTRHYVEGAISIILSALAALAWIDSKKWFWWFLAIIAYAVSLLCKEIYLIVLILFFWLPALQTRQSYSLFIAWAGVIIAYLWLRSQMLNTFGGGMMGIDIFLLLSVVQAGINNVIEWLLQNHLPIIFATIIALIVSTHRLKIFTFLIFSLILILIPAIFAPHAWRDTAIHANRIFILFYLFLALFSAVKLVNSSLSRWWLPIFSHIGKYVALIGLSVWAYRTGINNQVYIKAQKESYSSLMVNELLNNPPSYDALVVKSGFQLGELDWVIRHFRSNGIDLLLTELDVLQQYNLGRRIGQFNPACNCIELVTQSPNKCKYSLADELFQSNFEYNQEQGSIHWSLTYSNLQGEAGIIFLDRHFIIPMPFFSGRLVRPRLDETYRFYFIGLQDDCWLSPIKVIN